MNLKTSWNVLMNYGGVMGLALVIAALLVYLLGMDFDSTLANILNYAIMIGGLFYFMKKYRDDISEGYISFAGAFRTGILIMMFAGVIATFYQWIFASFIDPSFIDKLKEKSYEQYISIGMSEDAAVTALEQAAIYMTPGWMAFFGFIGYIIMGAILALILSFFIKKDNPNPLAEL